MEDKKQENLEEEIIDETSEELYEDVDFASSEQEETIEEESAEEVQEDAEEENMYTQGDDALRGTIARLQADFQNYRNRTEKEKSSVYAYANEKLMKKILPVIDNLERALATEKEHDAFFEGVQLIYNDMIKVLENEGLERFDPVGEKFDPNFHQAVFMEESKEVESEHIIETFQIGYKLKDRVIRPAMVKVAK